MKRKILNLLITMLCAPILMLCSCSNKPKEIPVVDATVYLQEDVTASLYSKNPNTKNDKSLKLSELLLKEPDPLNIDSFVEIKVTANSTWIYKMYIEYITFYVYTNKSADVEMIVNFKMTNLAKEEEIGTTDAGKEATEETCSFVPQENGSILCRVDLNKTVATATGSEITFDILNSTSGTVADNEGNPTDFRWMIYGLEIHGEHRAYNG